MVAVPGSVTIMLSAKECNCLQKATDLLEEFCRNVNIYDDTITAIYVLGPDINNDAAGTIRRLFEQVDSFKQADALLFDGPVFSLKREGTHYASNPEILAEYVNTIGEDNFRKYILRL